MQNDLLSVLRVQIGQLTWLTAVGHSHVSIVLYKRSSPYTGVNAPSGVAAAIYTMVGNSLLNKIISQKESHYYD